MSTALSYLPQDDQPIFTQPASSAKIIIALVCNLISWLLLVLAICMLPALASIAAGLFIFVGIPLALVSMLMLIACTCLLATNKSRVNQWLHYGVVASTVCGWIAHLGFMAVVVLLFSILAAP